MFSIDEVEAIPEVYDGAKHCWRLDFPGSCFCLVLGPTQGASMAAFPKIVTGAEPVIIVGTWKQVLLARCNLPGHRQVTAMVAENERTRNH